ncbi:MAG: MraY family glycosyltransferase [Candidatus Doudnabacteria bacterium]
MQYTFFFFLAFLIALFITPVIKRLAFKVSAVDLPNHPRKIHTRPIPLLGGFAIFVAFMTTLFIYLSFFEVDLIVIPMRFFWGMIIGGSLLMIGGYLDDKYSLSPKTQFIFPILAVLVVLASGIGVGINFISNPFGGVINLNFLILGIKASGILVFFFILGMIYTTKFLDGMDGLTSGISLIASLTLFVLSLTERINQPVTASIAIILCGAIAGFLVYNFNPASIFLGESGSTFLGFMLGVFSVLLGGKIATALLVMGIPILDVAWVIARRIWYGSSPFKADRKHLHFRLLDLGFSQRQTVLSLYGIAVVFGGIAISMQSMGKLVSLIILFIIMISIALGTVFAYKRKYPHIPENSN